MELGILSSELFARGVFEFALDTIAQNILNSPVSPGPLFELFL